MKKTIGALLLTLVFSSCVVRSINPLYTEKELIFDPRLVGEWGEEKEPWVFEKAGDKKYKLLCTDEKGRVGEFDARLVKLDKYLFLDLFVTDTGEKEEWQINDLARMTIITRPAHLFAKVSLDESSLKMGFLQPDWLKELVGKNPDVIRHEKVRCDPDKDETEIVLTAETKDLQKFMLKYADDEKAFGDKPVEMERKKVTDSEKKN